MPARSAKTLPWHIRLRAGWRLAIAVAVALAVYFLTIDAVLYRTRALICWNAGAYTYLALAFVTIVTSDAASTRARSRLQDSSRYVILVLVLTSAIVSVVAIGFLVGNLRALLFWERAVRLLLTILALTSSWLLIHILFTFHYARLFYRGVGAASTDAGGLVFPGGEAPEFRDFAYFSFVVGMTSQTSDVAVASKTFRRVTLVHSILSFAFNIAILAMSINLIAGII
jgi:uncharacterized membrane protein